MACGCPVITCANSSIPEVAGSAALYVSEEQPAELAEAIRLIVDPEIRAAKIAAGLAQAASFPPSRMAETVKSIFTTVPLTPPAKIWLEFRQMQRAKLPWRHWYRKLPEPVRLAGRAVIRLARLGLRLARRVLGPAKRAARRLMRLRAEFQR
jgi:hypothetical protein